MSKYIFTIILICILLPVLATAADSGGNGSKNGEYLVHDSNNYALTVHDQAYEGTHGGDDPPGYPSGEYPIGSGNDYLFQSWVLVGAKSGEYEYVIGGGYSNTEFRTSGTFYSTDTEWPGSLTQYGDFDTSTLCNDDFATEAGPIPILIRAQTWSFTSPSLDDCVGLKFIIHNDSNRTIDQLLIGYRVDFDIGSDCEDDIIDYDVGRELVYMYDSGSDPGYVGVTCGTGDWIGTGFATTTQSTQEFTDAWLFSKMQSYGWSESSSTPDDYRFFYVFEFDTMNFESGETIVVGLYQVAGMTLQELQTNADAARASYIEDEPPLGVKNIKSASLGTIKAIFK